MEQKMSINPNRILFLNTLVFIVCFAAWMINGVLVTFLVNNGVFQWTPVQIGLLLGVPVLVGSVFRLPVGVLTDKYGGKWVTLAILLCSAVPMFLLSQANSFTAFLILSFGFGLSGSSFAAGVAYTCLWFPKSKQGTALGIYGSGNIGAALTTLMAPSVLTRLTNNGTNLDAWRTLPKLYALLLLIVAIVFWLGTQNKKPSESRSMMQRLSPLKEIRVWRFGLYYFFVFGSFVALTQWLIPYYVSVYTLPIVTAGFMVSAFNLPAALMRAVGGWIADKVGARIVLLWVFGVSIVCLFFLSVPRMEIQAPGQGILAAKNGKVSSVSIQEIIVEDNAYYLQSNSVDSLQASIRFGIHQDKEGFLLLPTSSLHQEPVVRPGDEVVKGQLLAKGVTTIYFQANRWIFTGLIFIMGIMMGIGSAAVYKHISDYYPSNIGAVGGIVGVLGGLGGFFGPLLFSFLLNKTQVWTTCWMFLAVIAAFCIVFQRLAIKAIVRSKVQ